MIGRLRGVLISKDPPRLMLDVGGVGYELESSMSTFQRLPVVGEEVTLYTHLAVRDDAHNLYGFAVAAERSLFRSLIRVSGIGAKLALLILSGMSVDAFTRCVQAGDAATLTRLPGIGKKTAERLIVEMRDRIAEISSGRAVLPAATVDDAPPASPSKEAVSALESLGYKPTEATRMVQSLNIDGLASEEIIRLALQTVLRK